MSDQYGIDILTDEQCWELLHSATVGRLAVDVAGRPDIYPINFVIDDGAIIFRTGAGTKLAAAALMHHVAFEIDGYVPADRTAWSVVVKGWADQVESMNDLFEVEELPLYPWAAHPKPNFVKITPHEVTGRRFHVVDDATPDASVGWQQQAHTDPAAESDAVVPEPGEDYHPGEPFLRPG